MRRREFIALVGGTIASPLVARAQPPKVARIGALYIGLADSQSFTKELREGLRELGYIEGQNIAFEFRSAEGKLDRLPELAAELVLLKVDVIVTLYVPPSLTAKHATTKIPIVAIVGDPVETGIVSNLAHPGGNITGVSLMASVLAGKSVELFRDMLPAARRVGVLGHSTNPVFAKAMLDEVLLAGGPTGIEIQPVVMVRGPDEFESALTTMVSERADAVVVQGSLAVKPLVDLAIKYRLPMVSTTRAFADIEGLCHSGQMDLQRFVMVLNSYRRFYRGGSRKTSPSSSHKVRTGHQSQDCEGHGPCDPRFVLAARRRSARMKQRLSCGA